MKKTVRIFVSGTVQGIFYRKFVKESADSLDIKGFVRNLEDGRVEVYATGDSDKIDKLIELCKKGNQFSQIKSLDVKEVKPQEFKEFQILHFM
jgi:acylphosphatase